MRCKALVHLLPSPPGHVGHQKFFLAAPKWESCTIFLFAIYFPHKMCALRAKRSV
jgi:hypothetical protein